MLKRILVVAALVVAPAVAFGQATVIQGGSQTQGHIPAYATTGGTPVVTDGGTSAGGGLGATPSTIGITARCTNPPCVAQGAGPNGEDFAIYDGPTSDADGYHYLGFSANIGSKATITTGSGGGAAAQGLQFIIDGTTYAFPDDFPTIPVTVPNGGTGLTSLTAHNLLVGNGTGNVTLLPPSATSGVPVVSQGSGADPAYGTAAIAGGGTGATTATGALTNLLPSQTGQNGKVLATDGSNAAWTSIAGTGTVTQVDTDATLQGGPINTSGTLGLADAADGTILANISGGAAQPTANTLSDILDDQVGSGRGTIIMRGAATWGALTPGTNGLPLLSSGPGADLTYSQLSINNLAIAGQAQGDIAYFDGAMWTRLGAGTAGQLLTTGGAAANPSWSAAGPAGVGSSLVNGPVNVALNASVAANALTVALKTQAGTDPSSTDPVKIPFPTQTGGYDVLSVTGATSIVIPDTATLGTANNVLARVWVIGFNDSSTFRLCLLNTQESDGITALVPYNTYSATAVTTGSDSAGVIYCDAAVTTKAISVLGFLEITEATAGTWATGASKVVNFKPWMQLPGARIQTRQVVQTASFSTTSTSFTDVTGATVSITPTSAANRVEVVVGGVLGKSDGNGGFVNLVRGSTNILVGDSAGSRIPSTTQGQYASGGGASMAFTYIDSPAATSSTTYKLQARVGTAGTLYVGAAGADSDTANFGRNPVVITVTEINS